MGPSGSWFQPRPWCGSSRPSAAKLTWDRLVVPKSTSPCGFSRSARMRSRASPLLMSRQVTSTPYCDLKVSNSTASLSGSNRQAYSVSWPPIGVGVTATSRSTSTCSVTTRSTSTVCTIGVGAAQDASKKALSTPRNITLRFMNSPPPDGGITEYGWMNSSRSACGHLLSAILSAGAGCSQDQPAEKGDALLDPLPGAHQPVLMFDAQHPIVAHHLQGAEEATPEELVVAKSQGHVLPGAHPGLGHRPGVQRTVERHLLGVDAGILGMNMKHRPGAQGAHHDERIHILEEEMAGVKIGADDFLTADPSEALQRVRIIHSLTRVHLNGDADPKLPGPAGGLFPEGPDLLLPLPVQQFHVFPLPGAGHPVGIGPAFQVAGTAAHGDDRLDTQQVGGLQRVLEDLLRPLPAIGMRIQQIAIAVLRAELQAPAGQRPQEMLAGPLVVDQLLQVAVRGRREVAGADFHGLEALGGSPIQGLLKGKVRQRIGEQSYLHGFKPPFVRGPRARGAVRGCPARPAAGAAQRSHPGTADLRSRGGSPPPCRCGRRRSTPAPPAGYAGRPRRGRSEADRRGWPGRSRCAAPRRWGEWWTSSPASAPPHRPD